MSSQRFSLLGLIFAMLSACSGDREGRNKPVEETRFGTVDVVLFALDEDGYPVVAVEPGDSLLHGYGIAATCPIESPAHRAGLLEAFEQERSAAGVGDQRIAVDCFRPRHAIRVVDDGVTTDHLICFECRNLMTWVDARLIGGGVISPAFEVVLENHLRRRTERD